MMIRRTTVIRDVFKVQAAESPPPTVSAGYLEAIFWHLTLWRSFLLKGPMFEAAPMSLVKELS